VEQVEEDEMKQSVIRKLARTVSTGALAVVVASAFEGMSRLERHRMIYALFGGAMATQEIHALSITARTPGERQRATAHVEK